MFCKSIWLNVLVLGMVMACSAGNPEPAPGAVDKTRNLADKPMQNISKGEQKKLAEKFIAMLIADDSKAAFDMFSPNIIKRYPFELFEAVMKRSREKFGRPVSYLFKSEAEAEASADTGMEPASTSFFYTMALEKEGKLTHVPLVVTFGSETASDRLVNYKYLVDEAVAAEGEKAKEK